MDVIKYLTVSPELKDHANITAQDNYSLILAFQHDDDELVKLLLTEASLIGKFDIYNHISDLKNLHFELWTENCCEEEEDLERNIKDDYNNDGVYNAKVLKYLIKEYKLFNDSRISYDMDEILENLPNLKKIYQYNCLQKELEINFPKNKAPKV